ncbi:MAG: hypothetical protein AABY22_27495 [Nanoarchaeota archaeon]
MFKLYDKVKVIENYTNKVIKRGILVNFTYSTIKGTNASDRQHNLGFGQIYDKESEYDQIWSAEYFPFSSRELTIKKI